MSTIDNRVVEMNFDGSKFSGGVTKTLSMLDKLKAALHLDGASKGLQDVNAAAGRFNSSPMEQGVGRIAGSFTALQATAFGALANIGSKISNMALNTAKAFTLAPITAGFNEYELKMGSIQTILANTSKYGTSLATVNSSLDQLNKYADQTIYNFGDMTKNIGLFTNAGIRVEDATTMIKGFSNAAAASGTNAEGAAGAAYQLSQALSAGKVTLMDWRSLQNVGMGNKNMQSGIIDLAKAMGTFKGTGTDATAATKDFNGSLEKGWLKADVMSKYLKIMSGDMSDADMKALHLTQTQIDGFKKQAKMGLEAATKVRTFSQLMGTLKEAVGSGWTDTFQTVFGDFNQATDLFTGISNTVGGFIGGMSDARNAMLKAWAKGGGRFALIDALKLSFQALFAIMKPIGQAFRSVFPKTTADQLIKLTFAFHVFTEGLLVSDETALNIRRTFQGLFAILHIGWFVIKTLVGFVFDLLAGFEEGDKGILKTTATLGDFFVGLDKAISNGQGLANFLDKLKTALFKIINPIKDAGQALGNFLDSGFDLSISGFQLGDAINNLLDFGNAADKTAKSAGGMFHALGTFFGFFLTLGQKVANLVQPIASSIGKAISNIDFQQLNDALQTLSLGGIAFFIKQLGGMFKGLELFKGAGGGIMDKIKGSLDKMTGTLSAMQANLKASMLLKIAGAIALLAVSVVLLAGVDAPGLVRATAALTVMFVQLGAAMQAFQKIGSVASIAKLNLMGAALILMSVAILLLTGAVKLLASMSWSELAKGLGSLTVLITGLIAMSKNLDRSRGAILRSAASLILVAAAITALVLPIKLLGSMDLATLGKGLGSVAFLLISLALFSKMQAANKDAAVQGAALLLLAIGMKTLAEAVKIFASMSWEELARGFAGLSAGLVAMGITMAKMPTSPKMILTALAIAKVAGAMLLIASAFKQFANISWETIAKGIIGMGSAMFIVVKAMNKMPKLGLPQTLALLLVASAMRVLADSIAIIGALPVQGVLVGVTTIAALLGILVIALNAFEGTTTGAAAILVVAVALNILLPVIKTLGAMPIASIVTALIALAAVFAVLGVAAMLMAPILPVLMGLGIAIALIGAAMFLAGAGVALFAVGLTALAAAGAAGVASLVAMVSGLVGLIPMIATQIGKGVVALLVAIGSSGAELVKAFVQIVGSLLQAIIILAPKIGQALLALILAGLKVLVTAIPAFVVAGMKIIIGILQGIANNMGKVIEAGANIIIQFMKGIAKQVPRVVDAAFKMIIDVVNGVADAIRRNTPALNKAGANLLDAILDGIKGAVGGAGSLIKKMMSGLGSSMLGGLKSFLGINSPSKEFAKLGEYSTQGLILGLESTTGKVTKSAEGVGRSAIDGMRKTITGLGAMMAADTDMMPVISPVLDLSAIRRDASSIGGLLSATPLKVGASYSGASDASAGYLSNQAAVEAANEIRPNDGITFIQNNNSPKALSSAEIYRKTKSQLSVAKGALTPGAN